MTALSIQPPFPLLTDIDGQPLEDGYIWIGVANLPPIGNPIAVYWDAALTQPAALPVRTRGGYPVNAGTPARLYVNSDYSIQVQNKNGSVVYSAPQATERYGALIISSADISFLQAGSGAVVRTAQSKMRDVVSVMDFGAVGDGLTDDTAAINAAIAAAPAGGGVIQFGPAHLISSTIEVNKPIRITGLSRENTTASRIFKKSTMTTAAIKITGSNVTLENFALTGQAGNTGDGIWVFQQFAVLQNLNINTMGGNGVRLGDSIGTQNCNIFGFYNVRSSANGGNGFYLDSTTTDAGGGTFVNCLADLNSADGFRFDRSQLNTLIGCVAEANTAYGLSFGDGSRDVWWYAGDSEANGFGVFNKHPNSLRCNAQCSSINDCIGARVYNNAAQSIPNAVSTALTFNSEYFDTDAMHDPLGSHPSRLTATTIGKYIVTANVGFAADATGIRSVGIKRNGTTFIALQSWAGFVGDSNVVSVTATISMAVGDYVEVFVYQNSGGALNIVTFDQATPVFSAIRQN